MPHHSFFVVGTARTKVYSFAHISNINNRRWKFSGILWDSLGSSGILWDHLGSSGTMKDLLKYFLALFGIFFGDFF